MSIKVLFVHGGTLEKAGTERYMMNVLNHAQSHDIHIDFLVFGTKDSYYDEEVLMRGSKIYRVPYQFSDFTRPHLSIRKIKSMIKKENYDIVHSHMNALNYRVIKEMKKLGIKYSISHSHATRHFAENSHLISFLDQEKPKIADEANILLACSNEAGEFLYGNKNFIVLHNGIDLHSFGYSKKIRNALGEGNIKLANSYLGYNYTLGGKVVLGKQLGRTIGYPTANIQIEESYKLIPKIGVYAVYALINGQRISGMMNIGFNPTVEGTKLTVEINLFDFNQDIYDQFLKIEIVQRLRDEKKFDSLQDLKNQLAQDEVAARKICQIF